VSTCQALWAFISHHFLFVRAAHARQMVTGYNTDLIWRPNGFFQINISVVVVVVVFVIIYDKSEQDDSVLYESSNGTLLDVSTIKCFKFCFKCKFKLNLKIVSCAVSCVKIPQKNLNYNHKNKHYKKL